MIPVEERESDIKVLKSNIAGENKGLKQALRIADSETLQGLNKNVYKTNGDYFVKFTPRESFPREILASSSIETVPAVKVVEKVSIKH